LGRRIGGRSRPLRQREVEPPSGQHGLETAPRYVGEPFVMEVVPVPLPSISPPTSGVLAVAHKVDEGHLTAEAGQAELSRRLLRAAASQVRRMNSPHHPRRE
jgi:hypothetical protein